MSGSYNLGTAAGRIVIDGSAAKLGFGVAEAAADQFFALVKDKLEIVRNVGATMLASSTAAAGGFLVATNSAANFEERLSAVKAVSGASAEQMKQISSAALQIGKDTKFSATEAAQAFEELVKAGVSVQDALDGGAKATANLAAAGEIAIPRAAEIAATAMNNFKLTGKDMPMVADQIAGAANASAISVDEFASSLSQVGAVAHLTGVDFKDTAVAIAEMGNAGIKGSDAGTSLKTVLMNLIPQTNQQIALFQKMGLQTFSSTKALQAMKKVGIEPIGGSLLEVRQAVSKYIHDTEGIKDNTAAMGKATDNWLQSNGAMQNAFFDTSGKAKKLSDIQQVLQNATKGMTKEQKLANLQILFGSDAIRGAAVMADNGAAGYKKLATAMGSVTAADVAATRMDNLKGSIEQFKGSMETLMIQIGSVFLPIAKKMVDAVTAVVNWFINVNDRAKKFLVTLGALGTGLGLIVGALITAGSFLAPFILKWLAFKGIKMLIGAVKSEIVLMNVAVAEGAGPLTIMMGLFGRIRIAADALVGRMIAVAIGAKRMAAVAAFMSGPWGIVIGVIVAVIAACVVLYNTWLPFKSLVDNVAKAISTGLKIAFDWLVQGIQNAARASQPFFEWLGGVGLTVINGVRDGINRLVDGFNGLATGADPASKIMNDLGQTARVVWDALKGLWGVIQNSLLPALGALVSQLGGSLMKSWGDIANVITGQLFPALQQLGATIWSTLQPALKALGDAWVALQPSLKMVGDLITGTIWPAIVQLYQALGPIIVIILQVVGAIVGGLIVALIYVASFILGTVVPAILNFLIPVLTFLITAITKVAVWVIQYLILPFVQFITFLVGTVIPAVVNFVGMLVNGFVTGFNFIMGVIGAVVGWFQSIFAAIGDAFKGGADQATSMWDGVAAFFKSIWDELVAQVTAFVNFFVTAWNGLVSFLQPVIDVFIAMFGAFVAIFQFIVAAVTYAVQLIIYEFQLLFTTIGQVLTNLWTFIVQVWNNIMIAIQTAVTTIYNWLVAVWTAIWGFLQPILMAIWNFYTTVWNNIRNNVTAAVTAVWNVIVRIWNAIAGFLMPILTRIWSFIVSVWNNIVGSVSAAVSRVWAVIVAIWNAIWGFISGVANRIWSTVSSAFNNLVGTVSAAVGRIWSAVVQKFNQVVSFVSGIGGRVLGAIGNLGGVLWNAGVDLINGFLGGLKSMWDSVTGFFQNLTAHIPKVKGPPEKDKTLLRDAGAMIMQSLTDGLQSGVGDALAVLSKMNTSIPLTFSALAAPDLGSMTITPELSPLKAISPLNITAPKEQIKQGDTYTIDKVEVNNPKPETASESLPSAIRKVSTIGLRK